ncbi:putative LPS assembly protein LptD [Aureisphaera galaxeae]|uniref:putative LPS assembly protein LptD n=1 Tax=Aureisphaera galaxeae TaxID=1538023 RepID=UPI002350BAB4|nr:putative LPS assembly protein LptD [Aureisphaera galaxeae]MDC8004173.1 putative LPS assembly protein LptD [Aureisphaera galaxeae]
MHIKRHLLLPIYIFLLCCSTALFAQDPPARGGVIIRAKEDTLIQEKRDTLLTQEITLSQVPVDTVKTDTIKPKNELLTDVVEYYGEDYVYVDRKEGKVYMYNEAYIVYEDLRIDAGLIILDYNKNEVYAKGIDSAGVYSQAPIFVQGPNKVEPDSIRFNMDTKKAISYNSATEQDGVKFIPAITKRENDSVYYFKNVKFTTSERTEDPEYYFLARKAKFVPKKKVVTGLVNMYIADVPTPIGLPFAFFPITQDRTSGFIFPNIGEQNRRGFFFQNGGYYFALNDYVDLTLTGDYYTNGSYGLRGDSDYALRYKFRGNLSFRYESLIESERGFPDFSQSTLYNIRWSHTQDPKSSPNSRFSASVNLGSSRFLQQSINQTNNASQLVNTLSSSVSYSKTIPTQPEVSFTIAATHSQNTQTEVINMSLPNFNGSVSRVFPFAPKSGVKKGALQNINLQYNVVSENRIQTTDSLFFKKEMFDDARIGARHTIPLSTNFKLFDYLSMSMGANYEEVWVGRTFDQSYDTETSSVVRDTVSGFDSYRTYSFSTSLGTTLYGDYTPKKEGGKIQAIRHTMRPSISYSVSPAFDQFYDEYVIPTQSADPLVQDEIVQYSRFEGTLYGAPSNNYSSGLSYSLNNTIEAKVRDRDTTATEPKKISLINNLNFAGNYSFSADSLNFSPIRFSAGIPIIEKLELNLNGSLDPYALDNNNQRIDRFNIDNGGSLFRLTAANVSFNYSFSSKDFQGKDDDEPEDDGNFENDTFRNGGRPDDLFGVDSPIDNRASQQRKKTKDKGQSWYNYEIPWNLRMAYTMTYSNSVRQNEISSQSIMLSSSVELSPRWSVRVSSGYDFKNKGVTLTQLRFERDLESWYSWFSWTPIGARNTSWNFFIGIRGILKDIKYDKRREADRRL